MRKVLLILICLLICVPSVYAGRVGYVSTRPATAVENTPEANVFNLNGNSLKFILLDKSDEGFFCTTKEFYGTQPFDPNGTGKFDIEDENNIAHWLNTTFLEKGGEIWNNSKRDDTFPFPDTVEKYIVEHDWLCEAGYESSDYPEDYSVRAKLALMSVTEWKKYNDKIGYADNTDIAIYYWLRSVNGTIDPGENAPVMVVSASGTAQYGKVRNGYGIRPVFYLSNDFFREVKIDVDNLGDNVKKALRENYTEKELRKNYNDAELELIYKKLPPQAKTVLISGVAQTGSVLKGSYTYYSPEGESEGESKFRWLRAKNKNGPFSVISGENSLEFEVRDIDEGYYFVFEVIPQSIGGIGKAVRSKVTNKPAEKDGLCRAENVYIDGKAVVGERLIARYNYYDENRDVEDGTLIRWQVSDNGIDFSDIPGAIGLNYTIPKEINNKYIRFEINPKSLGADAYGESVFSDVIGPIQNKILESTIMVITDEETARIISPSISENETILWTIYDSDYKIAEVVSGAKEYRLKEKDTFVQAVSLNDGSSTMERVRCSEIIRVNDKADVEVNEVTTVNSEKTVFLKSYSNEYAHSLEIHLDCSGVEIEKAESEFYDVFLKNGDSVIIILTGKNVSQLYVPENVVKLNMSGDGDVRITKVKGVYEFNNKIVNTTPDIYFE